MADPFPDESSSYDTENMCTNPNEPFSIDKNIYPDSRYCAEHSPMIIYVPSRVIMIKLMRACMGCDKPEDLWFNNGSDQIF